MLKAKITKTGSLQIERVGQSIPQQCHFYKMQGCNHNCPHFDDSDPDQLLLTCGGTAVLFEVTEDARESKKDNP